MTTAIILVILGGWVLITAFVLVVACMFSSRLTQPWSRMETLRRDTTRSNIQAVVIRDIR